MWETESPFVVVGKKDDTITKFKVVITKGSIALEDDYCNNKVPRKRNSHQILVIVYWNLAVR